MFLLKNKINFYRYHDFDKDFWGDLDEKKDII